MSIILYRGGAALFLECVAMPIEQTDVLIEFGNLEGYSNLSILSQDHTTSGLPPGSIMRKGQP